MYKPKVLHIKNFLSHEDTFYEFKQGEAILLFGINDDDSSQKGNGSGKSAILEGIAVGITGDPIRNIKTKELVRNNCKEATVYLELEHTNGEILSIERRIFSGTKSQQVSITVIDNNGNEDPIKRSDVDGYNKFVFEKIGISKDDFYDFFLITKEHYKPFLSIGDSKKKAIINRFSGAYKIDKVFDIIDGDVKESDEVVKSIDKSLSSNKGKQELLNDQIQEEYEKDSESVRAGKVSSIKDQITIAEGRLDRGNEQLEQADSIRRDMQEVLSKWSEQNRDHKDEIAKCESEISELSIENSKLRSNLTKVKDEFKDEIETIKTERAEIEKALSFDKSDLQGAEKLIAQLNNKIAGVIECPKCSYEFILADKKFNVKSAKAEIEELTEMIRAEIKPSIVNNERLLEGNSAKGQFVNQKILDKQESIKQDITANSVSTSSKYVEIEKWRKEDEEMERMYRKEKKAIQEQEDNVATIKNNNKKLNEQLIELSKKLEDALNPAKDNRVEELKAQLDKYINEQSILEVNLQDALTEKADIERWTTHFKAFKSYLANSAIKSIGDYTNMYLHKMDSNLSILLQGYKMLADNKTLKEEISVEVLRDGFSEGNYAKFSSGERGRIDVGAILAIQHMINLNSTSGGLDFLGMDEILDSVDSFGLECILESVDGIGRTIMIVSQNSITSLKEKTLIIKKQNQKSRIV